MAVHLTDPAIEDAIQALATAAPPMTEDQRAKLSRLLRLNRKVHHQAAQQRGESPTRGGRR